MSAHLVFKACILAVLMLLSPIKNCSPITKLFLVSAWCWDGWFGSGAVEAAPQPLVRAAALHVTARGLAPLKMCTRPSAGPATTIEAELPFVVSSSLLTNGTFSYEGFGARYASRRAYRAAAEAWRARLPERLRGFTVSDVVVLPPDARGVVACRHRLAFDAPVPPSFLPAQRARIASAQLTRTADGLVPVEAVVASTLWLDGEGRVARIVEQLAFDPSSVTETIAHYEINYARRMALLAEPGGTAAIDSPIAVARAWWGSLRELTRRELDENNARSASDEQRVLGGGEPLSDAEFDRVFAVFVGKNFLAGGAIGGAVYLAARALRENAQNLF